MRAQTVRNPGLDHQVGQAQVVRTAAAWGTGIGSALAAEADGSRAALKVKPRRAVADAKTLLQPMQA